MKRAKYVAEPGVYRSFVVASQSISWLVGQLIKLRFATEKHRPSGLFEHGRERCLILDPRTNRSSIPFSS